MTHHILAPFHMVGGGIWHAIDLATELTESTGKPSQLWSAHKPDQAWQHYGVRTIAPYAGDMPNDGNLWVVGPDNDIGHWYPHGQFRQITLIYNQHALPLFYKCMHLLSLAGTRKVDICYISRALANETGIPGKVKPPAFNRRRFLGTKHLSRNNISQPFTVGKATRDIRYKHHPDDPFLYKTLLRNNVRVELVGATNIIDHLPAHPNLHVRGEISQTEMTDYLLGLDCLVYRTADRKPEGFGLCILEAMALGLPIVASRSGGYTDIIRSGENGFLFDTNEDALKMILLLKENPDLREQIGVSSKRTIEELSIAR